MKRFLVLLIFVGSLWEITWSHQWKRTSSIDTYMPLWKSPLFRFFPWKIFSFILYDNVLINIFLHRLTSMVSFLIEGLHSCSHRTKLWQWTQICVSYQPLFFSPSRKFRWSYILPLINNSCFLSSFFWIISFFRVYFSSFYFSSSSKNFIYCFDVVA